MREVICIKDWSEMSKFLMITNGITPPVVGDSYHVTGEKVEADGTVFISLVEYMDSWVSPIAKCGHWFDKEYFAEVTGMQEQIDEALKASKPAEPIKEMNFDYNPKPSVSVKILIQPQYSKLSVEQTKVALACYKLTLMGLTDRSEIRQCCGIINRLYLHLQNITHNA